jgi:hypothetical protein
MSRNLWRLTVVLYAYTHESYVFVSRDEFRILYRRLRDKEQTYITQRGFRNNTPSVQEFKCLGS